MVSENNLMSKRRDTPPPGGDYVSPPVKPRAPRARGARNAKTPAVPSARSAERAASMVSEPPAPYAPTEEEIRVRAYHRYLERGAGDGLAFHDWLEAERELRNR
jgi:hypothetical protein